ncbi:KIAA1109 [Cordylochernes scorpioides]|uniref:KIAA1109 n=1 Tax=Cordylochernes scorpioides TaxID=51811 RepID=A0ABY6L367_9ARAC|nr:KIAA1109 [Cordylochernes scorpioides]
MGSISVSVLSGKIMFRDVAFIDENSTVRVQDGLLIFRWWYPYVQKEITDDLSHCDTRISLILNGLEFHVYNRSQLYSHLEQCFGLEPLLIPPTCDTPVPEGRPHDTPSKYQWRDLVPVIKMEIVARYGNFTMEQNLKQRICIEFCVKLEISATKTSEMLNKAFPNDAPKRTNVFEWHSRFKACRISVEDDPRQGHPKFQKTDENLEQDTGISKTTIGRIVTEDLKLKKTPAKFISRFLTIEKKLCLLATYEDMLEMTRTDLEWKDKIITGDENQASICRVEMSGPKNSRILKFRNKVLLVTFLDNKGIVHHEYLPAGQTVIKEMYLGILRRLREAIRKKGQKN